MMATRVTLDQGALDRLLRSPDGVVGRHIVKATVRVEAAAKRKCPVDTGRLRSSLTHRVDRDARGIVGVVGSDVEYAVYVELGTLRTPSQPFLRPALEAVR